MFDVITSSIALIRSGRLRGYQPHRVSTPRSVNDGSGSKREQLNVSISSPVYPNDQTLFCMCEKVHKRALCHEARP
jgi:hypothetical protein